MSLDNPYDFQPSDESVSSASLDPRMHGILEELRMPRPWVRLMSLGALTAIAIGFWLLSIVGVMLLGAFVA